MIKIDVVVDELLWKNKIKRPKAFFEAILKLFPKKYNFKTKNKAFSLLPVSYTHLTLPTIYSV